MPTIIGVSKGYSYKQKENNPGQIMDNRIIGYISVCITRGGFGYLRDNTKH